jgi:general secretion pathway protein M
MNAALIRARTHLATFRSASAAFWAARQPRERKWIGVAVAAAIVGLLYGLLIDPALNGRAALSASLPALRQQVTQMQTMATQTASLHADDAPPDIRKQDIEAALARKGLRAQTLAVADAKVRLQFSRVAYSDVVTWLADLQHELHLAVTDAAFTPNGDTDSVDATLTLQQLRKEEQQ